MRNWFIFSETYKYIYCYTCKTFSKLTSKLIDGCQNWRHVLEVLSGYGISKEHITSVCILYRCSSLLNKIVTQLVQENLKEENYCTDVLQRI